jgi:cation diffusion facilitator CzcD-associated flavoprotein CzcO
MSAAGGKAPELRFIIIGAGPAGLMAAIRLQQAGFSDIVIYEKAARLGGTWRDNTYPGVACDVPSHLYCYSFALNPQWSRRYAPGAEILEYLNGVAVRYGVARRIRFSQEVVRCELLEGRWRIETAHGDWDSADVVIAATGVTHHPRLPEIRGREAFAGAAFHSARWDHATPLDGHRIGVIGTGSTAVQIVAALSERAARLTVFQRTPQWIMPQDNPTFSEEDRARFRAHPEMVRHMRAEFAKEFTKNFSDAVIDADSPQLEMIAETCRTYLESQIADPVLREKFRPSHRAACKRLIVSNEFYPAMQRPNAELVDEPIECIETQGVRTRAGGLYDVDVLVFATGFRTDRFMRPMRVIGCDGACLDARWAQRPDAYLSVAIPGFPNFFMLNGPNSPVGNFSLIEVAELQMNYLLHLIELLRTGRARAIAPTQSALATLEAARVAATQRTVWVTGCQSWYLDDRGVPASWPWTMQRFREVMAEPALDAYELG